MDLDINIRCDDGYMTSHSLVTGYGLLILDAAKKTGNCGYVGGKVE